MDKIDGEIIEPYMLYKKIKQLEGEINELRKQIQSTQLRTNTTSKYRKIKIR